MTLGKPTTPSMGTANSLITFAAACIEARLPGSAVIKMILTCGCLRLIWSMTGCASGWEWPVKMIVPAPPWARASAVVEAKLHRTRPDRTTVETKSQIPQACPGESNISHVLCFTRSGNIFTTSAPWVSFRKCWLMVDSGSVMLTVDLPRDAKTPQPRVLRRSMLGCFVIMRLPVELGSSLNSVEKRMNS